MVTIEVDRDLCISLAGHRYGFAEYTVTGWDQAYAQSYARVELGPAGAFRIPVSADAGLVISLGMVAAPIAVAAWWARRRQPPRDASP